MGKSVGQMGEPVPLLQSCEGKVMRPIGMTDFKRLRKIRYRMRAAERKACRGLRLLSAISQELPCTGRLVRCKLKSAITPQHIMPCKQVATTLNKTMSSRQGTGLQQNLHMICNNHANSENSTSWFGFVVLNAKRH